MNIYNSFNNQLDDLLIRICRKIQVSQTEHEKAQTSYSHVARWLADAPEGSLLYHSNPIIYPQGSLKIGTHVKPYRANEFDVDLVCEFQIPWTNLTPEDLLQATFKRLQENEVFKRMLPASLEPNKRCVTLTYKNDFHIDVLPSCPATLGVKDGNIKVANKMDRRLWKDSNPKAYSFWFENISNNYSEEFQRVLNKALVEKFPEHEEFEEKTPLQRSIQILKRNRDIEFYNSASPQKAPISVVITTLAARHYQRQGSVNLAVRAFLSDMISLIASGQKIRVPNPTNPSEDFGERWQSIPGSYEAFTSWLMHLHKKWEELNTARGPKLGALLKELFGEEVADSAIRGQVEDLEKSRSNDQLGINMKTGYLTTAASVASIPVRKNTFFGGSIKE